MRLRKCKVCGVEFNGEGNQRLCASCRKAAMRATVVMARVCTVCGTTFQGGPRAKYCPECRAEIAKERDKAHKRKGAARPLGSIDVCQCCGKEYTVNSGSQKYCSDCAAEAVRQAVLPAKRKRSKEKRNDIYASRKALTADSAVCAYCGKTFTPTNASVTCSPECEREHKRIVRGMAAYRAGRQKNPPSHERYSSGLPQSDMAGVTFRRRDSKWQVVHDGRYVGIYETQAEAEAKKLELENSPEPTAKE